MTLKPSTHAGFAFSDLPLISSNFPDFLPSFHYGIHYKSESTMNILQWPFDGDVGPDQVDTGRPGVPSDWHPF
jgi:hypothetical protein